MSMTSGTDHEGRAMQMRTLRYLADEPNGRFLLTIHTHADVDTGELCNSDFPDGVGAYVSPIDQVCSFNLGDETMSRLRDRHAIRGLLLLSCGPSMGRMHYPAVLQLVTRYIFFSIYLFICA